MDPREEATEDLWVSLLKPRVSPALHGAHALWMVAAALFGFSVGLWTVIPVVADRDRAILDRDTARHELSLCREGDR